MKKQILWITETAVMLALPEKQVTLFTAMFSWPQLVTALAGGGVALLAVPIVRKALGKS